MVYSFLSWSFSLVPLTHKTLALTKGKNKKLNVFLFISNAHLVANDSASLNRNGK